MNNRIILPLNSVGIDDIAMVGGKCASLGEMLRNLTALGVQIPDGFVITTTAYWQFIEQSGLGSLIQQELERIDFESVESLRRGGLAIRQAISNARFPRELSQPIISAYEELSRQYNQAATDVAVRSSA